MSCHLETVASTRRDPCRDFAAPGTFSAVQRFETGIQAELTRELQLLLNRSLVFQKAGPMLHALRPVGTQVY